MSIYDSLNEQQRKAVFHTEGPLLILAGAGSGKTRVLTRRIAYLIAEQGVNPWNILAITFTNKAAQEMRERVDRIVGYGAESIWVSTFHSTCVRILRRHIDRLGYDHNFAIYDADDQKTLIKDICRRLNIDTKVYKEKSILAQISHAKDEMITPDEMEMNAAGDYNMKKIAGIYREYQAALRKNNALDFDDLLTKTVELFQNCGDVLESYQERFRYIMVDEYQDTNTVQFKFVSLLAGKYENLCVVGDDDQSIYKFRGANIGNILGFERVFPGAMVIRLEQNYRSTQNILDAANSVIRNNVERKSKTLWTENEEGEKLHVRQFQNGFEEAEYIIGDIIKNHKQGKCEYRDCAVLYRTNAQSRVFEEKCIQSNIPYKIVGGVNFYARKEIKDLLSYLKTVDNTRDDLAVRRIINIPKRGIGASTIEKIQTYADTMDISFYDAMRVAEEIPSLGRSLSKVDGFVTFMQSLRSKAGAYGVTDILKEIIELTGYVAELEAEGTDEAQARIENIDELISKTVSYEEAKADMDEPATLSDFLEEVALIADIDSVDNDKDYILLLTLHSAKGLEFPYVYLAGMEDGIFPSYMSISSGDLTDIEEERRLAYVGITRAMKDLTLTSAQQRMIRGEVQYNRVSRFVKEIDRDLVEQGFKIPDKKEVLNRVMPKNNPYMKMRESLMGITPGAPKPKEFTVTKASSLEYEVGDTVRHVKFGVGLVKSIVDGGRDYEVTVDFDRYGVKKMFAGFAKLKKI
ncbi:MAG: DNA helicase PcrA [Clostridiales bacterium]|nr:DNA helicase PcrA [Candidatus Blautia equi]